MNAATVVLVIATATAFLLLLWVIGHLVTMVGERAPYGLGRPRQYLAGGLDGIQIIVLVYGEGELLVSLSTPDTEVTDDRLARVFRVAASECSLARVRRWRDEGTLLRGFLSNDGAVMLADPVLGGNAACEPSVTPTRRRSQRTIPQGQSPTKDTQPPQL